MKILDRFLQQYSSFRKFTEGVEQEIHDHIMLNDLWDSWGIADTRSHIERYFDNIKGINGAQKYHLLDQLSKKIETSLYENKQK